MAQPSADSSSRSRGGGWGGLRAALVISNRLPKLVRSYGGGVMIIEVLADPESVAQRAAAVIAAEARSAVAERGRFVVALTGGHTPWIMLRALAREDVPWESLSVVQVDERVAPDRGSCFDVVVVD